MFDMQHDKANRVKGEVCSKATFGERQVQFQLRPPSREAGTLQPNLGSPLLLAHY